MRYWFLACLLLFAASSGAQATGGTSDTGAPVELIQERSTTPSSDQSITYSIVQAFSDQDTEIATALIQSLAESFTKKGALVGTGGAGKYDSEIGLGIMYEPEQQYETYTLHILSALKGTELSSYSLPLTEAPKGLFCGSNCRRDAILKNLQESIHRRRQRRRRDSRSDCYRSARIF